MRAFNISSNITKLVRSRIEEGGERLWRYEDFGALSLTAVAQALSRLTKEGVIRRISKGTYYRFRQSAFGESRPNPATIQALSARKQPIFPSGLSAANLLGLSTQVAKYSEIATSASTLPRKLLGKSIIIHTRRPAAWSSLDQTEAAILDVLRHRGKTSELSSQETTRTLLKLLSDRKRRSRIIRVAKTEPPRVRAILGALCEQLNAEPKTLEALRSSLNPLSRFDFGLFANLYNAKAWQAKGSTHEIM